MEKRCSATLATTVRNKYAFEYTLNLLMNIGALIYFTERSQQKQWYWYGMTTTLKPILLLLFWSP